MSTTTNSTNRSQPSTSPFVNHGLERWNKTRMEWLTPRTSPDSIGRSSSPNKSSQSTDVIAKSIDVDDVIDRIFGQNRDGQLPEPIPLGQMIDILIDFWEADGVYD